MPAPEPLRLSVIMPVYNEEGAIVHAIEEVQRHVLDHVPELRARGDQRRLARSYGPAAR